MAYQFYLWDAIKGFELIGEFPERRRNSERITDESIMNWGRITFVRSVKADDIFFVKVELEEGKERRPKIILNYSSCLLSIYNRRTPTIARE